MSVFEQPKPLRGVNVNEDLRQLWDTVWRLTEQLRLADEEQRALIRRVEELEKERRT